MPLNPKTAAQRASFDALNSSNPLRDQADAALAAFRQTRDDLKQQVKRGELTPKIARQRASQSAAELRASLEKRAQEQQATPADAFLNKLVEVEAQRQATPPLEALQQETNRLLRQNLVEQQLQSRLQEFESQAFVRPLNGGRAAPTLQSLLAFHDQATLADDQAAREWARRELEAHRSRVVLQEDRRRIDTACDRPDRVNPAIVSRYLEALENASHDQIERFVTEALQSRDASACCAAFAIARQTTTTAGNLNPEENPLARLVLEGVSRFPDQALASLKQWEAQRQQAEALDVQKAVEAVAALAESESRLSYLKAPSESFLRNQDRMAALPIAEPDQPIGLTLSYRGRAAAEPGLLQEAEPAEST